MQTKGSKPSVNKTRIRKGFPAQRKPKPRKPKPKFVHLPDPGRIELDPEPDFLKTDRNEILRLSKELSTRQGLGTLEDLLEEFSRLDRDLLMGAALLKAMLEIRLESAPPGALDGITKTPWLERNKQ